MNGHFWVHGNFSPYFVYSLMAAVVSEQTFLLYVKNCSAYQWLLEYSHNHDPCACVSKYNLTLQGFFISLAPIAQFLLC